MTPLEQIRAHKPSDSPLDLSRADLWEANLSGANLSGTNLEEAILPSQMRLHRVWAGGPRHRTATIWTWNNHLAIHQGCVTAHTIEDYVDAFLRKRGNDWEQSDVDAAIAAVTAAAQAVTKGN